MLRTPLGGSPQLTSANVGQGLSPVAQLGTRGSSRALPGQIINTQAQKIGTLAGVRPNPLADVANWKTGGRQAPFNLPGSGDMTWWYIGGAVLLAAVLMRRKK
jgi:hypothetical protein